VGHFTNLTGVSPDVLGLASVKLETLTGADVSSAQIEEILTRVATTGESKLKKLVVATEDMGNTGLLDLTHMDPEILTEALVKLEINLGILRSYEQMTHLLTKINTEDLRLKTVNLFYLDISELPLDVWTGAVSRVETLGISFSDLTPGQLEAIFTMLASQHLGGSKLKVLWVEWFDLSAISPEFLIGAIRNLEVFDMSQNSTLTAEQVNAILSMVVEASHGKLNEIIISHPEVLGTVNPELLQAAKQMEDLLEITDI